MPANKKSLIPNESHFSPGGLKGVSPRPRKKKVILRELPRKAGLPLAPTSGPGANPDLLYHGGPIINNPQVYAVFLGDWTSTANQNRATRLEQFITDLLSSSYMNILSQYGCGSTGNLVNSVFISNSNNSLTRTSFVTLMQTAINNSTLPEPGGSDVFIVFFDDSTGIKDATAGATMCEATSDNAFGYHDFFTTTAGNSFFFAIIPGLTDTCLTESCTGGDSGCSLHLSQTQEQRQTQVTSHEFSEMISDPKFKLGWWGSSSDEDGDICNGSSTTITVGSNTWTVQNMYSKWDDMQTDGATTCVSSEPFPLPSLLPACALILDRSTFGKDEVDAEITANGKALSTDAIYVVVDGFVPEQLGLNSGNLTSPPVLPTFAGSFAGLPVQINFDAATGVQLEDSSTFKTIQRITFPFNVQFNDDSAFNNISNPPGYKDYTISASITNTATGIYPSISATSSTAEVQLVLLADPFMSAGETTWLSNDIRVFQVTSAKLTTNQAPLQNSSTRYPTTGTNPNNVYITNLIQELNTFYNNSPATTTHPFDLISSDEDKSALQLNQDDGSNNPVFNFALTRVRLIGDTANNVRVFFRLFISSSPDTTYDQATTYRRASYTDTSGNNVEVPLLGFVTGDMPSTIPFFAVSRVDSLTTAMSSQPEDTPNVQTIPNPGLNNPPAPGQEAHAYFGCWLDLNQPTAQFPVNPSIATTTDGPWQASEIFPIPGLIMGNHACLLAEIAYDPDPIPPGANAGTSDKLGQRNLDWGSSDNPGPADSHRVPLTFDLRPTSLEFPANVLPDELMIDWGNTPAGSVASIYWPQVNADDVLDLANRLYAVNVLSKKDANTIQCLTGSVTYIPIPRGAGPSFAGLITIDMPSTVRTGQLFKITVRRVSWRNAKGITVKTNDVPVPAAVNENIRNWRYVVGTFQINIPVSTGEQLLAPEETLLAVFKWKIDLLPTTNKWYPVLQKYIELISARVNAFGGNATEVGPSLGGYTTKKHHPHEREHEHTGKVSSLVYDRFGDFEGFTLLTESGHEVTFSAREQEIERIVKDAWAERMVVTVFTHPESPHLPVSIVLRRVNHLW
ncbi:MAG: hypothetical protein WAO19_06620 [Candidatus Kryptoniota bacterium]